MVERAVKASSEKDMETFTWDEIKRHTTHASRWIVIENEVFDVTTWLKKHPGGQRVLQHYSGQDATEAFKAFHKESAYIDKFKKTVRIGRVKDGQTDGQEELRKDFEELRQKAIAMGLFKPSVVFFTLIVGHLIFFELLAYLTFWKFGAGWIPWFFAVCCLTIVQAQGGWSQHDFGHLSVFQSTKLNHFFHLFVMCFIKGAGANWWNHLHYQHHAKPNVMNKDPDVRLEALFVLGESMPKMVAKEKKKSLPYNLQHKYFFALLPPLLFPVYFQIMIFQHSFSRRKWMDIFVMGLFYLRMFLMFQSYVGFWGVIKLYFMVRCLESHWFVWVSQSNHIPMEIEEDKERPWLPLQLYATCDIEKSAFNDWFTGHLNFQIEHHCFPTMPRHNLYKIAPQVKALCEKHHIPYHCKTMLNAYKDIISSLKHSGEIWYAYYQVYHSD